MKKAQGIEWHYPRLDLAEAYLSQFATGIGHSITLFAPRRKGKTEFLVDDLAPAAEKAGYRVVYVSFWAFKIDPARALLDALQESAKKKSILGRARKFLSSPVSKLEAEGRLPGANLKLGAELAEEARADKTILLEMPKAMDELARLARNGKVILLLDEVQFLARPAHEDFIAALRTALDTRKRTVHVVFTGSSRGRLQDMFDCIQAPLFQFSQTTTFPDLGEGFTSFMAVNFKAATGRTLDEPEAWEAFNLLSCSPGLFREAINHTALSGGNDILDHAKTVRDMTAARSDLQGMWNRLRLLDRLVVRSVVRGEGIYSDSTRREYARILGVDSVSTSQVQAVVKRLTFEQVLFAKSRGAHEIEDTGFRDWLLRHLDEKSLTEGEN
jgi:hypothetical protein